MKILLGPILLLSVSSSFAVTWTYQVSVNGKEATPKQINDSKSSFEAGPHYCEVTPMALNNNTEFRSLICNMGTGTVSTGALCTRPSSKMASVQYAILNLTGPKSLVNVVVACKF